MLCRPAPLAQRRLYAAARCRTISRPLVPASASAKGQPPSSAFTGVSRQVRAKTAKAWRPEISYGGKQVQLGMYNTEEEAARTWDKAAVLTRAQEGIQLNFPLQGYGDAQGRPLPDPRIEVLLRGDSDVDPALAGKPKSGEQLTSAFTGVRRMGIKWQARILCGGKMVLLGSYDSEEEAARTWDKAAVLSRPRDGIKLNFPLQDYLDAKDRPLPEPRIEALLRGDLDDPALAGRTKSGKQLTSAFTGVRRVGMKWEAQIFHDGKKVRLGCYDSEEEAARTWDKAAVLTRPHDWQLQLKLNHPLQDYLDAQGRPLPDPRIEALLRGDPNDPALAGNTKSGKQLSSAFTGVSCKGIKWQARIATGGKQVHLGMYNSEEEAARSWDKAAVLTRPHDVIKLNFPLQGYLDAQGRPLPDPRIEALLRASGEARGDRVNPALDDDSQQLPSAAQ